MVAMVSTAILVAGGGEVGKAQTVAVEDSAQSIQKISLNQYNHRRIH